jgi:hypothetical protein
VLAELIGQASFTIAPLTDLDAEEPVGGQGWRLVRDLRGAPAADAAALVDLVLRLRGSGSTCRAWRSSTSTFVLALPDRCVVVDARSRRTCRCPAPDEELVAPYVA